MVLRAFRLVLPAVVILINANASGHHSFSAEFTAERKSTITGVVTEVWFRNPHVRYYIDVTTPDGSIEKWDTRGGSPSLMTRRGWTKDTIKVGDTITLMGHQAHDPDRKLLSIIWVELANGTRLQ